MKTLTCNKCKTVHKWDYDKSYKALLESGLPLREVKCPCGTVMNIIKIKKYIPKNSIIAKANREAALRGIKIVEERMKSPQIICQNCKKESGWYKERDHEIMPEGHTKNLLCGHCTHTVLVLEGGVPEKHKVINKPKVYDGYAGYIKKKRSEPVMKRRVKVDKTPIIKW